MKTKTQERLEKEVVNKCNWCGLKIGTNEWKCLKCQGYKLAKENFEKLIDDLIKKNESYEKGASNRLKPQYNHTIVYLEKIKEALIKNGI